MGATVHSTALFQANPRHRQAKGHDLWIRLVVQGSCSYVADVW